MPFNPRLSEPSAPGRSARGSAQQVRGPSGAEIATDAFEAVAGVVGPMMQNRRQQRAAVEQNDAFVEFQSQVIDQENELIAHRAQTASTVQELADLQSRARRSPLDDSSAQRMGELQRKKQRLEQSRQEGGLTDAGFRIRQNELRKQALRDPRLAGMQDDIDKVFNRHQGDFDPLDDMFSDADRQRLGPNPSAGQVTALINEKRIQHDMNMALVHGDMTSNTIDQNLRPQVFMEGRKIYESALTVLNEQGAIDPAQMDGLRQMFGTVRNDAIAAAHKSFQRADQQGHIITRKQREEIIKGINDDVDRQMEFLEDKDLKSRLKNLNELEEEAMKQNLPVGLRSIVGVAGGGSPGDVITLMNMMSMDSTQMQALVGEGNEEYAELITLSSEQRLRAVHAMTQGVDVPGNARLKAFISANMLRNGTTDQGLSLGVKNMFEQADSNETLGQTFDFFNEPETVSNLRGSEEGMQELKRRVKSAALALKERQTGRTRAVVRDGRVQVVPMDQQAADNPILRANMEIDQQAYRKFNEMFDKYPELERDNIMSVFDDASAAPDVRERPLTMQELEQEQRDQRGEDPRIGLIPRIVRALRERGSDNETEELINQLEQER